MWKEEKGGIRDDFVGGWWIGSRRMFVGAGLVLEYEDFGWLGGGR